MKITELILALGLLTSLLMRELISTSFDGLILVFGTLLGLLYLFFYWRIEKPNGISFKSIFVTILYSLALFCFVFSLVFQWMFFMGADQLSTLAYMLVLLAIVFNKIFFRNSMINKWVIFRTSLYSILALIFLLIPSEERILFTYRNNSGFLEYYKSNKERPFQDLREEYFNQSE